MSQCRPDELERAVRALQEGQVVAAATETFFGLLADAANPRALDRLWGLKPRTADKAPGLIAASPSDVSRVVERIPEAARALMEAFWPGPLTLALPARPELDARLSLAGTVAIRVPAPCAARELAERAGMLLTATSANLPGVAPATTSPQVRASFRGQPLLVLPGQAPGGLPSTVIAFANGRARLVRAGAISLDLLMERAPELRLEP